MNSIIHYCGHIISADSSGRFPLSNEKPVQQSLHQLLLELNVKSGYGSLASGADILVAENLIKQGAELHLIFPFDINDFLKSSVIASGNEWQSRFKNILDRATSVTQISYNKPVDENLSYALCTEIALGLSLNQWLKQKPPTLAFPKQVTVWDKEKTLSIAGTYPDMLRARLLKFETTYIDSLVTFNKTNFNEKGYPKIQPLNLCVYTKANNTAKANITELENLLDYLLSSQLDIKHQIDLDRGFFGKTTEDQSRMISPRALGHIIFHCYAKEFFPKREQLVNNLLKFQKQNTLSGKHS